MFVFLTLAVSFNYLPLILNFTVMRLIFTTLCCFIVISNVSAQKFDTTYHSSVTNGFVTGEQKSWRQNTNEYHYLWYNNDRGRGENIHETVNTDANGQIISSTVTGVDYYKNPYSLNFSIVNDSAIWIINNTRKSKKYNNQIYNIGSADVQELQLKWLLNQPDKRAITLNDDTVRLKYEPTMKKITFNGKTVTLKLYARYFNSNPLPGYIWMTEDMHFFGDVGYKGGLIIKGYESWIDTLFAIQELANKDYFAGQIKEFSNSLKKHIFITHANLFISSTAVTKVNMTIEILNGKIKSIFPTTNKKFLNADTVIYAKGKFLMPGLWDMHCHYGKGSGLWYLAGGVTHIRDMATPEITQLHQKQIASNELLGPEISYISGFIDRKDSLQAPVGKIISTLEEGLLAIDYYHKRGYDQIKLYSSIKPDWVKPMCDHAHGLGMKVSGHVPAFMTAAQAINAGYNEITHNNMIFLNFMGADTLATNGIARLRIPAALSGKIDLQSKEVKSFIQLMKQKSISHDPTLGIQEGLYDEFIGDTSKRIKPIINWMPESNKNDLANTSSVGSEEQKPAYKASFRNSLNMVKLLFDNGILLVAGTDGGNAIALHRELEIYNEAGIPANEVLKIATYNAAKDCGLENVYGQIAVGKSADFILIDGNPAKNISDIRRVEWVIKNGRMYSPKQLLASKGWKYYY